MIKNKGSGITTPADKSAVKNKTKQNQHLQKSILKKKWKKERLIRTLKPKIYEHMTAVSKNVCIDKLSDIVNECNNAHYRKIKMNSVDVKDSTYIDFNKEVQGKDFKFRVGDHVIISKYRNIFVKGHTPNWSKEVFVIKEVKKLFQWHMLLVILIVKKLLEHFIKRNCKKII